MTKKDKQAADEYILNPFQKQQEIADKIGVYRQQVTKSLNKPEVKAYIEEQQKKIFHDAQMRALHTMQQLAEQTHNLAIRYKASEFLLKCAGYGTETKVKVEAEDSIHIKITDEDKS